MCWSGKIKRDLKLYIFIHLFFVLCCQHIVNNYLSMLNRNNYFPNSELLRTIKTRLLKKYQKYCRGYVIVVVMTDDGW